MILKPFFSYFRCQAPNRGVLPAPQVRGDYRAVRGLRWVLAPPLGQGGTALRHRRDRIRYLELLAQSGTVRSAGAPYQDCPP
jgi:hypothetical protein